MASDVDDNFTGTNGDKPNPDLWAIYYDSQDDGDTSGVVSIQNNTLDFSLTAISMPVVQSVYRIDGNFDIQIDWSIDEIPTTDSGWMMPLGIGKINTSFYNDSSHWLYVGRFNGAEGPQRAESHNVSAGTGGTQGLSGKARIVRTGSSVDMKYWSGSSWVTLKTDTSYGDFPVYVKLPVRVYSADKTLNANFDNFLLNAGDIIWPSKQTQIWVLT